jgi:phospholipid-translocating ATPase
MFTKGADEALRPLLAPGQAPLEDVTQQQIDEFASLGLRTMLVASRRIARHELEEWEAGPLREANASLAGREARIAQAYQLLEKGLMLLGGTAIQDRLQQGVPASMRVLREGGVKIWMVTGDKASTAKQIGTSSGLLPPAASIVSLQTPANIDNALEQLSHLIAGGSAAVAGASGDMPGGRMPVAIVLTGSCLAAMNAGQLRLFAALSSQADAAVCCRLTPDQKAQLVNLMRTSEEQEGLVLRRGAGAEGGGWRAGIGAGVNEEGARGIPGMWRRWAEGMKRRLLPEQSVICAIGDGANDVAMIQTAHVGIGIAGREGSHAVRASDVSIASFSDLTRLLLLHGSWSYQRSALVAQISFFKSWAFCFAQVMYSQTTAFGGTSVYDPFSIAACNALLFIPITFFAFNRPVPMATVLQRPHLYRGNADWQLLNMSTVGGWFLRSDVARRPSLVWRTLTLVACRVAAANTLAHRTSASGVFPLAVYSPNASVRGSVGVRDLTSLPRAQYQSGVPVGCCLPARRQSRRSLGDLPGGPRAGLLRGVGRVVQHFPDDPVRQPLPRDVDLHLAASACARIRARRRPRLVHALQHNDPRSVPSFPPPSLPPPPSHCMYASKNIVC